jgi:TIR domain
VPGHQHTVFVAYARIDAPEVDTIVERLRSRGIKTSVDREDISVGEEWVRRLETLIREADTILFMITPRAMVSPWCQREVDYAVSLNKRILPVLLKSVPDDVIPPNLARLQYLVLTDIENERAFNTLVDAIYAGAKYGQGAQGNNIFLSYRRLENAHVAGRIYDNLEREFGDERVFFDVEGIPIGVDFRDHIRSALLQSQVLLVVIGQRWAARFRHSAGWLFWTTTRAVDYVRIEIEVALDHNVRIIPLLVDGATMPSEHQMPAKISQICYYQAAPIRGGRDFRADMTRVRDAIKNPPRHATV